MKALVLYFTRTGNTKLIAEAVAETLRADVEAFDDGTDYSGVLGFLKGGKDAFTGRTTDLSPLRHSPDDYDLVVIGQPVWAARPVPAVNALAARHPMNGRPLALFVTYDGMGDLGCLERTAQLFAQARVGARISFLQVGRDRADSVRRAKEWARELAGAPRG